MPTGKRRKEQFPRKRLKRRYFLLEFVLTDGRHLGFDDQQQMSNFFVHNFRRCWGEWGEALLFSQHYTVPKTSYINVTGVCAFHTPLL